MDVKNKHVIYGIRMIVIMLAITMFSILLNQMGIGKENVLMLFIVGVLLVAYCTNGYQYGIIASLISVMSFNYLFTEPLRTFTISRRQDVILLVFFLVAALISSNLTVRFQKQVKVARENEQLAKQLSIEQERIRFAMEKEQMRTIGKEMWGFTLPPLIISVAGAVLFHILTFDIRMYSTGQIRDYLASAGVIGLLYLILQLLWTGWLVHQMRKKIRKNNR